MLVHLARDHIGDTVAPVDRLAQRAGQLLGGLDDRAQMELGVAQEPEQQLHRAVARPAPHAHQSWSPAWSRR